MSNSKKKNHKKKSSVQKSKTKNSMNTNIIIACVAVIVIACIAVGVYMFSNNGEKTASTTAVTHTAADNDPSGQITHNTTSYNPQPLDESLTYYADIDIRDYGTITVKLDQASAPVTCANFVELANSGFYNGLTFHRIMEGFMMQGGDPRGNGTGGSDNKIVGEFAINGHDNPISHTRGTISMARSAANDSASSQFFIVHEDSTFLDGQYAGFGVVTEGIEIVDAVCTSAQPIDGNGTIPAEEQPIINSITIRTE